MAVLRMGLVGGGEGSFIGPVHRLAAELDGRIRLVCGAFSSDPATSLRSGTGRYGLDAGRCYSSWRDMFVREAARPADDRMQFVAIATPNHLHVPVARAALEAGFHVVCDKPLASGLADALELERQVRASGLLFAVTYNYSGYPMVREARALIASGAVGKVRRIVVEYLQGWLATPIETSNRQAGWRTDPARAGAAGCIGDIGTHAVQLAEYVTGCAIDRVCADLASIVPGRALDDDGDVFLRFEGGARGVLIASQIAVGEENALRLRVYGEQGALDWSQQEPNTLIVRWPDRPAELRRTAGAGIGLAAAGAARLPAGHPEGYLESFANVYRAFADALTARLEGGSIAPEFPGIDDGVRGMRFVDAVVASAAAGAAWREL
jgi:predicted dehydrogenase